MDWSNPGKQRQLPVEERFWQKVDFANDCWVWQAELTHDGYGRFKTNGHKLPAHRWSYEYFFGTISINLQLDHLCRTRNCVNPYHLELVTAQTNTIRGQLARGRSLYCGKGHYKTSETLYKYDDIVRCKLCDKERHKEKSYAST